MPKPSPAVRSIEGKRMATTLKAIKARQQNGTEKPNERAVIRLGTRNTDILTGKEDLSTWDDEELRHGARRSKTGGFRTGPMKIVPKAIHDELVRRTLSKANALFNENLIKAVEILVEICTDPSVDAKDRLKAIQMITDRAMGKAPEKIAVSGTAPWVGAINAGIVSITPDKLGASIDANTVDEGEDEDE